MVPWLLLNKRFSTFVFILLAFSTLLWCILNLSTSHISYEYEKNMIFMYYTYTKDTKIHIYIYILHTYWYYVHIYIYICIDIHIIYVYIYTHTHTSPRLSMWHCFLICVFHWFLRNLDQGASVTSRSQVFAEPAWIYISRVWNSSDIFLAWERGGKQHILVFVIFFETGVYIYRLYIYTWILLMIRITT